MSAYSRRNSDNASDVEVGTNGGLTTQKLIAAGQSTYNNKMVSKAKKSKKMDKKNKNISLTKKYFDAKKPMHVPGDYRGSNYTMSSDDEVFNVSGHAVNKHQFPPIKKSMHQAKDVGSVYSNQIMKPKKK